MKNITSVNQNYIFSRTPEGKEERTKTTKEFCKDFMEYCKKEIEFYDHAKNNAYSFYEKTKAQIEKEYPFPSEKELQEAKRMQKFNLELQKEYAYKKHLEIVGLLDYIHNLCDMEQKYITLYHQTKAAYNVI